MEDLIKRSDAMETVCKGCLEESKECRHHWMCPMLTNLAKVPSADRPQGEWVAFRKSGWHYDCYKCSNCGKVGEKTNFCPHCGARMRPKLQGKHFDSIILDECVPKGADDETN